MVKENEMTLSLKEDRNKRFLCGEYKEKIYTLRVPLDDWYKIKNGNEEIARKFLDQLILKIQKALNANKKVFRI